ncbi:Uncharacterized protein dnm_061300 [Desulfonema magnum]|uniref:Uncharacterized protein n=1 Tax=Desulfonema magnum TaxID=45655 RepID=A0A975BRV6_9BACT|nr:Uncharacterized protein dnm_061300 [Desulfonema magnum]
MFPSPAGAVYYSISVPLANTSYPNFKSYQAIFQALNELLSDRTDYDGLFGCKTIFQIIFSDNLKNCPSCFRIFRISPTPHV